MSGTDNIVLIAVTQEGVEQARRLRARLRTGELHRPARYGPAEHPWEHPFATPLVEQVPALFTSADQMVFFLAAGAVIRLIARCLSSKQTDPGVLAVDEAGHFVISLLSGHKGGANDFARIVAGCLGATPVITTASDVTGGLSLDLLEDRFAWTAEPAERLKLLALAAVNGKRIGIFQEIGERGRWLNEIELPANFVCVFKPEELTGTDVAGVLWISDRVVAGVAGLASEAILWYRPKSLILGVGCERGLPLDALEDGLHRFLDMHGFSRHSIGELATVDIKADESAIVELAGKNGWKLRLFSSDDLARVTNLPNPSEVVEKCIGAPGVAEPAALLASGAEKLLVEKQVWTSPLAPQRMTFALARSARFIARPAQGKVIFIGAGPGDPELLTVKARRALARAEVVVFAGSLIPDGVLQQVSPGAKLHNSAHLTLEEVMEILVAAARAGRRAVRLHSGDLSLYSAIQEQIERLDEAGIDYEVVPGISSYQALAAALGCELTRPEIVQTIILTRGEGQTPMPERESLAALAQHRATLAIFLSARLAEEVQAQLLTAYPPETPVVIGHRVSWPDEKIIVTALSHLAQEIREQRLTRTTLILVGAALKSSGGRSQLYDPGHTHIFRSRRHAK
jgi:precorrin-4 C11-methyltransferase